MVMVGGRGRGRGRGSARWLDGELECTWRCLERGRGCDVVAFRRRGESNCVVMVLLRKERGGGRGGGLSLFLRKIPWWERGARMVSLHLVDGCGLDLCSYKR